MPKLVSKMPIRSLSIMKWTPGEFHPQNALVSKTKIEEF